MIIGYVLLALGVAVFILSFVIPAKTEEEERIEFSEDMIRDLVNKEVESARGKLNDIVEETVNYAMEKTERSVDKLTNEKMMAVNEYSDSVLSEINKNHQEVVFLYDMLNDKQENLKDTVSEVEKRTSEAKQIVQDAERKASETMEQVKQATEERKVSALEMLTASKNAKTQDTEMGTPFVPFVPERIVTSENVVNSDADAKAWAMMAPDEFEDPSDSDIKEEPEVKKPRKKRTTKPRVKEEAVSFATSDIESISEERGIIFGNEEAGEGRLSKDAPDLNLGSDVSGQVMGGRNNNEKILELHNAGKSNMAIARELGLGIGEVKLVIGLYEGM